MDLAGVPWQKIHDYLLQLETAESRDKLLTLALANIDNRLVLTNRVYWNEFADSEFVTDFARPRGWARCIGQLQPSEALLEAFPGLSSREADVARLFVLSRNPSGP